MAKPVKPAKKKKSGNLLVHVVILLLLATVGWRLYALQGQVRAAQAERDQYARQVERMSSRKTRRCGATSQKVPLKKNYWNKLEMSSAGFLRTLMFFMTESDKPN